MAPSKREQWERGDWRRRRPKYRSRIAFARFPTSERSPCAVCDKSRMLKYAMLIANEYDEIKPYLLCNQCFRQAEEAALLDKIAGAVELVPWEVLWPDPQVPPKLLNDDGTVADPAELLDESAD